MAEGVHPVQGNGEGIIIGHFWVAGLFWALGSKTRADPGCAGWEGAANGQLWSGDCRGRSDGTLGVSAGT